MKQNLNFHLLKLKSILFKYRVQRKLCNVKDKKSKNTSRKIQQKIPKNHTKNTFTKLSQSEIKRIHNQFDKNNKTDNKITEKEKKEVKIQNKPIQEKSNKINDNIKKTEDINRKEDNNIKKNEENNNRKDEDKTNENKEIINENNKIIQNKKVEKQNNNKIITKEIESLSEDDSSDDEKIEIQKKKTIKEVKNITSHRITGLKSDSDDSSISIESDILESPKIIKNKRSKRYYCLN